MRKLDLEIVVGIFVLVGLLCLAYLSVRLGKMEILGQSGYELIAKLSSTGGLKAGSVVEIAGVEVGRVKAISLDRYQAKVVVHMNADIKIQEDAILSVKTKGLMGEKYISISPGGSERLLAPGELIRETQPPVDLEELLSKYIYGKI